MNDLRPVGYSIGLMTVLLGATMLLPGIMDYAVANPDWQAFVLSAVVTTLIGGALTLACMRARAAQLGIRQAFLLTVLAWVALPFFATLPFMIGAPGLNFVDAFFESVSAMTTTGATIFDDLNVQPPGILLWRMLLHWIGGIGIVVFAIIFMPTLAIGGMQLFRIESIDPAEKLFPRVTHFATSLSSIYIALTLLCAIGFGATGMNAFDAICHAMSTMATGGFSNYDSSFTGFSPASQYVAMIFMVAASLPFVRYVQFVNSGPNAFRRDPQIGAFFAVLIVLSLILVIARMSAAGRWDEETFRLATFNLISIQTGTGFTTANYGAWDTLSIAIIFLSGLIGGCGGSTCCSIKIFRYQILMRALGQELRRLRYPNGSFALRYAGRRIDQSVAQSVLIFFFVFALSLMIITILLALTGMDVTSAFSGAVAALACVGPALGEVIGPSGNYEPLSNASKLVLCGAMLLGRLEIMGVLVLLTPIFWRR
ncbi:MAG: TrkH family potassium uptake protein [Neomegalonema sp.]|nr:TrkH family potassium uptake protein [Neomegalonema sp.]